MKHMNLKPWAFLLVFAMFFSIAVAAPMFMQLKGTIIDEDGNPVSAHLMIELSGRVFFNQTEIGNYGIDEPIYVTTSDDSADISYYVGGELVKTVDFEDDMIADIEIIILAARSGETVDSGVVPETTKPNPMVIVLIVIIGFLLYKMFFDTGKSTKTPI